jgi:hypothetical protein
VSGGNAREAVLPLDNRQIMRQLGAEIASQIKVAGGNGDIHIHMDGSLSKLVNEINAKTRTGRLRLHATTSDKTIRKA